MIANARTVLRDLFAAAVAAASPAGCVPKNLPPRPRGRTIVVGAGKAAAAMAAAVEHHWDGPLEGLVVTRYGHGAPCTRIRVVEAGHPVPDAAGPAAAREILSLVGGLTPEDLVLCLISGGGSALLALPAEGVTLADKQAINRALLRSGAHIGEMNVVRKHLSAIKGGQLAAAAAPAQVVSLIISDVPRDDLSIIASGPTVADPSTNAQALAILRKYKIEMSAGVLKRLSDSTLETPKPGDIRLARVDNRLIATPQISLEAAAEVARAEGFAPLILGNAIEGEAREVGIVHAGIAMQCASHGQPAPVPCCLISGGETTVTVRAKGRGGRNAEFLLSLMIALDGHPDIAALACDTDGIDGSEDNAGAVLLPESLARLREAGVDAQARLADNDAYSAFESIGDLVVTGPTRTNVNDFRAILVIGKEMRRQSV